MKKAVNDNVKLKENQRVMPFTLKDVIKEAKKIQPHYSLGAQLTFYVTYTKAIADHSGNPKYRFIAEQKLRLVDLLVSGSDYMYRYQN